MDITYCYEHCLVGRAASEEFLNQQPSAFDAAADFWYFTENCFKTCPHKQEHLNKKDKEST